MENTSRVLIDANVLYSRTLRDWFGMLASSSVGQIFTVCWTEDIMAEVIYSLRRRHPELDGGVLSELRDRIERSFSDGKIHSYKSDPAYAGKDPNDRHVHSAAVAGEVQYLVTQNVSDLSPTDSSLLPYEIYTADAFLVLVDDSAPEAVAEVTLNQWRYFFDRDGEVDLCSALKKAGAPEFSHRVAKHCRGMQAMLAQLAEASTRKS